MKSWIILVVALTASGQEAQNCVSKINSLQCSCKDPLENSVLTTQHIRTEDGRWINAVAQVDPKCNETYTFEWIKEIYENSISKDVSMGRKGYERLGDSLYKFHTVSQTWENARRTCEKEGAHLAIINSDLEAGLLRQLYKKYPSLQNVHFNDYVFIGFHDMYNEREFLTIFGEPIDKTGYTRWYGNIPDNAGWNNNGNPGEDCGSMHRDGTLNDLPCDFLNAFICELEDKPNPPPNGIDYSEGAYRGVESVTKPPTGRIPRTNPGEGYEFFPGVGFYRLHTNSDVWENARRTCEKEGAHLAIVNNEAEAQVLSLMFMKNPVVQDVEWNDFAFVGFHDQFNEGDYLTIYGEPLTSTGYYRWWDAGDPNDLGRSNVFSGQDCGGFYRKGGYNDLQCNKKHAFFCEKELLI